MASAKGGQGAQLPTFAGHSRKWALFSVIRGKWVIRPHLYTSNQTPFRGIEKPGLLHVQCHWKYKPFEQCLRFLRWYSVSSPFSTCTGILPFYNSVHHQQLTLFVGEAKIRTASWENVDKQMPRNTKAHKSKFQMT